MDDFEKFYLIAVNYLSYRPRSEKEVRDKLKLKNAPPEIIEKVIETLKQQKFINDEEFARMWTSHRLKLSPKSKRVIKMELLQKGIDAEIIEKKLSGNDGEEVDDLEQAKKLVENKIDRYKNLPKQEIYQKLGGFLARRGFSWGTIKAAIDECPELGYNKK